jgi:hypothetical protein
VDARARAGVDETVAQGAPYLYRDAGIGTGTS